MDYAIRNVSDFFISLQKTNEIVNRNFMVRVYIEWIDREFNANNWKTEAKRKYQVPFTV